MIRIAYSEAIVGGRFNPRGLKDAIGGPSWVDNDRYDILAKAEGNPTLAEILGPMFRTLLEDRFGLKVHTESRDTTVYLLTVANANAKLQPIPEGSCVPPDLNNMLKTPPAPGQPTPKYCGFGGARGNGSQIVLDWTGVTMADLAGRALSTFVDHPIVDRTGLTGRYNVHLEFDRDDLTGPPAAAAAEPGPSVSMALQGQLGLKLKVGKAPVDVIVVDRVEKPSAN
jgi:uncharacterized protein (TIGR03435 family)